MTAPRNVQDVRAVGGAACRDGSGVDDWHCLLWLVGEWLLGLVRMVLGWKMGGKVMGRTMEWKEDL
jgi:hypothetical protein